MDSKDKNLTKEKYELKNKRKKEYKKFTKSDNFFLFKLDNTENNIKK